MSQPAFERILVMSRKADAVLKSVLEGILLAIAKCHTQAYLEQETATYFGLEDSHLPLSSADGGFDLLVVVGGDGSILQAAAMALKHNMALLGINQGRLGFLTDIGAKELDALEHLLAGHYQAEQRLMLHMQAQDSRGTLLAQSSALNDVVLLPGSMTRMIEFELHVDGVPVCHQRSDGIIATTPTGSTAHAMSAGGPIVHPQLDAITLVPLCPHKLSSRPIVVPASQNIQWLISDRNNHPPCISCDGSVGMPTPKGAIVSVKALPEKLRLIHPHGHNHYHTLQQKLGWERQQ